MASCENLCTKSECDQLRSDLDQLRKDFLVLNRDFQKLRKDYNKHKLKPIPEAHFFPQPKLNLTSNGATITLKGDIVGYNINTSTKIDGGWLLDLIKFIIETAIKELVSKFDKLVELVNDIESIVTNLRKVIEALRRDIKNACTKDECDKLFKYISDLQKYFKQHIDAKISSSNVHGGIDFDIDVNTSLAFNSTSKTLKTYTKVDVNGVSDSDNATITINLGNDDYCTKDECEDLDDRITQVEKYFNQHINADWSKVHGNLSLTPRVDVTYNEVTGKLDIKVTINDKSSNDSVTIDMSCDIDYNRIDRSIRNYTNEIKREINNIDISKDFDQIYDQLNLAVNLMLKAINTVNVNIDGMKRDLLDEILRIGNLIALIRMLLSSLTPDKKPDLSLIIDAINKQTNIILDAIEKGKEVDLSQIIKLINELERKVRQNYSAISKNFRVLKDVEDIVEDIKSKHETNITTLIQDGECVLEQLGKPYKFNALTPITVSDTSFTAIAKAISNLSVQLVSVHKDVCGAINPVLTIEDKQVITCNENGELVPDLSYALLSTELGTDDDYNINYLVYKNLDVILKQNQNNLKALCNSNESCDPVTVYPSPDVIHQVKNQLLVLQLINEAVTKRSSKDSLWDLQIPNPIDDIDWCTHLNDLRINKGTQYARLYLTNCAVGVSGWFLDVPSAYAFFDWVITVTKEQEVNRTYPTHTNPTTTPKQVVLKVYRAYIGDIDSNGDFVNVTCLMPPRGGCS